MNSQNLCYVAYDYKDEKARKKTRVSMEIPGEGEFSLGHESFETGEILFQPRLAGV